MQAPQALAAKSWYGGGVLAAATGDAEGAARAAAWVVRLDPEGGRVAAARLHLAGADADAALRVLSDAHDQDAVPWLRVRGEVALAQGDRDLAVEVWQRAAAGGAPDLWPDLWRVAGTLGREDGVWAAWRQATLPPWALSARWAVAVDRLDHAQVMRDAPAMMAWVPAATTLAHWSQAAAALCSWSEPVAWVLGQRAWRWGDAWQDAVLELAAGAGDPTLTAALGQPVPKPQPACAAP